MIIWNEPIEFEWDRGNSSKNLVHGLTNEEIEEVFFDPNKRISPDLRHSQIENRHMVIGKTKSSRWIYVVITIRLKKVRVISARYMHEKEVKFYEKIT